MNMPLEPCLPAQSSLDELTRQRDNAYAELDGLINENDELSRKNKELELDSVEVRRQLRLAGLKTPQEKQDLLSQIHSYCGETKPPAPQQFIVDNLVPAQKLTIIAAPGGSGKSIVFGIYLAFCLILEKQFLGLKTQFSDVLYVDFELEKDDFERRGIAIANGMGLNGNIPQGVHYWNPLKSLADQQFFDDLEVLHNELGFKTVIIDSLSMGSMGADMADANPVIEILQSLARLSLTIIALDHVSHHNRGAGSNAVPFGSVFKLNGGRSVITISEGNSGYVLHHVKANFSQLHKDIAYTLDFSVDTTLPETGMYNVIKVSTGDIQEVKPDPRIELVQAVESLIQETGVPPFSKDIQDFLKLGDLPERTFTRRLAEASKEKEESVRDNGIWKFLYRWKEGKSYRYTTYRFIGYNALDSSNNVAATIVNGDGGDVVNNTNSQPETGASYRLAPGDGIDIDKDVAAIAITL